MVSAVASAARRLLVALALASAAAAAVAQDAPPLVSAQWLMQQLGNPRIVVLDIRSAIDGGGVEAYRAGHIPGAVHSDYDKAGWRVTRQGTPFMLPSEAELEKLIGEIGIDEDSHVVVVPAGVHATDFGSAARVYWTFKVAGHRAVSILDGGHAAWIAAAYPVERGHNPPSPKIFTVKFDRSRLAVTADVEAALGGASAARAKVASLGVSRASAAAGAGATLIDARPARFFDGKEKAPAAKAYGHIPGALNLDSAGFYDPKNNRLRPKSELAAIAASVPAGPVVSYCNTGHWAATNWFVLSELLGRKDVKLYDGSMVEWSADASRPIASSRTRWDDLKKALGLGS